MRPREDDGRPGRERPERFGWLVRVLQVGILVATLGFAFLLGGWLSLRFQVRRSPEIAVPNLVGQDAGAAEEQLRASGLTPQIAGRRYDAKAPEGKVLSQVPAAGSSTRPGRPVRLVVSLGTKRAVVPDVGGSSEGGAQLALRSANLEGGTVVQAPDAAAAGRVIGQNPPAGAEQAPGDKVELVLSAGPEPRRYVMPDLVGRELAPTVAALARYGFNHVRQVAQAGGGGTIVAQEPKPGYPVAPADTITLTAGGS